MKLTYPKFTPVIKKTPDLLGKILAIIYHTIIPVCLVYGAMKFNDIIFGWLLLIPIFFILLVRLPEEWFSKDEKKNKRKIEKRPLPDIAVSNTWTNIDGVDGEDLEMVC